MDDERFRNGWLRTQNYEALEPVLNEAMKARTTGEWVEELEKMGIPCGPVNNIAQVAEDPQIQSRNMIAEVRHHEAGAFKVVNTPFRFSRTPSGVERASPDLGEHTRDVLSNVLGMTEAEFGALESEGII
ncbi:MAG: CoA transferase [Dehalococcoidia bacterium]|nr:CoA transferase [Dehalococcoidia bacterium]